MFCIYVSSSPVLDIYNRFPNFQIPLFCSFFFFKMGQTVVPIFYHIDPSDIRKQMGSFGESFSRYEKDSN